MDTKIRFDDFHYSLVNHVDLNRVKGEPLNLERVGGDNYFTY